MADVEDIATFYVHTFPPRVLQMNPSVIRQWLRGGEVDHLEQVVLEGQGHKLIGEYSPDPKVRAFLKQVPEYMARIGELNDAVNQGSLKQLQKLAPNDDESHMKNVMMCKDHSGVGLLHKAVYNDHPDIVKWLLKHYPQTVGLKDRDGKTALHYCGVCADSDSMWNMLLQAGADVTIMDARGRTAAYYMEHPDDIGLPEPKMPSPSMKRFTSGKDGLVVKPSNIRIWIHDRDIGRLQQVLWEGHGSKLRVETSNNPKVKKFLDGVPYIMNMIKDSHTAAIQNDYNQFVKKTSEPIPVDILNSKDVNGLTPLHKAAGLGHTRIVKDIVERLPKSVFTTDHYGRTALHYAAAAKNGEESYNCLIDHGGDEMIFDQSGKLPSFYRANPREIPHKLLEVIPDAPRMSLMFPPSMDWSLLQSSMGPGTFSNLGSRFTSRPVSNKYSDLIDPEPFERNVDIWQNGDADSHDHNDRSDELEALHLEDMRRLEEAEIRREEDDRIMKARFEKQKLEEKEAKRREEEEEKIRRREEEENIRRNEEEKIKRREEEEKIKRKQEEEMRERDEKERVLEAKKKELEEKRQMDELLEQEEEERRRFELDEAQNNELAEVRQRLLDEREDPLAHDDDNEDEPVSDVGKLVKSADVEGLATLVLDGEGRKLLGLRSKNQETQNFLDNVPVYMKKIEAVHKASREGELRALQAALDRRRFAVSKDTSLKVTPLHVATLFGKTPVVKYLGGRFPETLQATDRNGRTALHYAACIPDNGHYFNLLLNLGANRKLKDKFGRLPQYYMDHPGQLTQESLLREMSAPSQVAKEMLSDKEFPFFGTEEGKYLADALGEPLTQGLTDVATKRPADPIRHLSQFLHDYNGRDQVAVPSEQPLVVPNEAPPLNNIGPPLEVDDWRRDSPLPGTSKQSDESTATLNTTNRDEYGQSILHFAAARSQGRNSLFQLIQESSVNIGYRDELYRTARDVAVQANLPNNIREIDKFVLSLAARGETERLVELLLEGYDHILYIDDDDNKNIIDVVSEKEQSRVLAFLRSIPAFEEKRERLHRAIRAGDSSLVQQMMTESEGAGRLLAIGKSTTGRCCLHVAVLCRQGSCVEFIATRFPETLKLGDNLERTALHYAMGLEDVETASTILIKCGAERVVKDLKGRQPSYYFMNKSEILRLQEEELLLQI